MNGSKLPMSIIIVGVGDSDFSSMEELDGDGGRLKFKSQVNRKGGEGGGAGQA